MAAQRPFELVEILLLQRRPDGLPQFVLGDRIHGRPAHDVDVVAVDDLAVDERVREVRPHVGQHAGPEVRVDGVGRVQPPAVDAAVEPMAHDLLHERGRLRRAVVELHQIQVPLETGGGRLLAGTVDVEKLRGLRIRVRESLAEHRRTRGQVVEHAVEQDLDAPLVGGGDQAVEGGVIAQAAIDAEVIERVVAMRGGLEDRSELQDVEPQLLHVVEPPDEVIQARGARRSFDGRLGLVSVDGGSGEPQRVDVPADRVLDPVGRGAAGVAGSAGVAGVAGGGSGGGVVHALHLYHHSLPSMAA